MSPDEIVAALAAAHKRIEDPKHWLHGDESHYAVDAFGGGCRPEQPHAERFDMAGAVMRATSVDGRERAERALAWVWFAVSGELNGRLRQVVDWHDRPERTHAEVLRALDRARELAEAVRDGHALALKRACDDRDQLASEVAVLHRQVSALRARLAPVEQAARAYAAEGPSAGPEPVLRAALGTLEDES